MKRAVVVLIALAVFLVASMVACGGTTSYTNSSDCSQSDEECLWVRNNGQITGRQCAQRCAENSHCNGGLTCAGAASSCPSCADVIRVCDIP